MTRPKYSLAWLSALFLAVGLGSPLATALANDGEDASTPEPVEPKVAAASSEGEDAIAGFQVTEGWQVSLFAAEPDVANIVAFDIDNLGRVFVCESFRQNQGVTDNRGHDEEWLKADLAAQTVQDRIDYHRRLLGDEANNYTRQDDRIRLLVDSDGDGRADSSKVFARRFNRLEDGTGAGVLARGTDVFYTNIPRLYKLVDADRDGQADERIVMSDGYGVRVAFRGHDLHGLVIGPDGRLYWSIGDRGYNVVTPEGDRLTNPAVGAVFRCELDGSNLEVFAMGLRNPQELAFNDYGDLFTGDNNSDSGDRARLVHLVQDGDSGWRMFYQYLPDRGPFNREKIWHPFHDEQPAYLVPPIANFGDGPSGLTYYPGTGFGDQLANTFLMADFRGTPSSSGIRTFQLEVDGAFYALKEDGQVLWNILATDVAFGPDGAMYVSDWVNGWDGEGKGRIYRITAPEAADTDVVREVQRLLGSRWSEMAVEELSQLLRHKDRRVRFEAQWELASRGEAAPLIELASDADQQTIPRLHGIWGLEQIVRRSEEPAANEVIALVGALLEDEDPYVRAAAAKFAGEHPATVTSERLIALLRDESSRVRYFAARALGWRGDVDAMDAVVLMLAENDNRDPVLRHGGVMALAGVADAERVAELASHPSANVRRAAVVALRRQESPLVVRFLADGDERVVAEAARAIHDLPIDGAWQPLAELIDRPMQNESVIRRALNANFRLGGAEHAQALARYAGRDGAPESMRLEALAMLGDWATPDPRDRVLNQWRPLGERPRADATAAVEEHLASILAGPESVRDAAVSLAADLGLDQIAPMLVERLAATNLPARSRAAALRAMAQLAPETALENARHLAGGSETADELRVASIEVLARLAPEASTDQIIQVVRGGGSIAVQQAAWDALAGIDTESAKTEIARGVDAILAGALTSETALNIVEAARETGDERLQQKIVQHVEALATEDPLAPWLVAFSGGDAERGEQLFFTKTELSCVRCHKVGAQGGEVGPDLTGIGKEKDRRYLLESLVAPDAQIAKGYETTVLADDLGTTHVGIVRSETDEIIELVKADGSQVRLRVDEIVARRRGQSAMPADLVQHMSQRELRDLVAYLSVLTEPAER